MKIVKTKTQIIIWPLLFFVFFLMGAKISDDTLRLGVKTGSDVNLQMGDGRLKWNDGTSKLQFSNDFGSLFKDIGSGGGGAAGVNLIAGDNEDFESGDPPTNWTASAGTFIAETSSPGFDGQSGSWDAAAGADTLDSVVKTIPKGLENRFCNTTIQYKYASGSSGDYKLQAVATGAGVVGEIDLEVSTIWRKAAIQFDCPSSDSIKVRITSTVDGGIILLDNATIGRSDFVSISQTELVAHAFYPGTAGCDWNNGGVGLDTPSDSDCVSISVVQSTHAVNTTDNDQPDIVFDLLPSGVYKVTASFVGRAISAAARATFRITDGVTNGNNQCSNLNQAGTDEVKVVCHDVFTYSVSGARTFRLQSEASTGNTHIENTNVARVLTWTVERYPLSNAEALTLETTGWHIDANIGGANPSLGVSAVTTYDEIIDASLDLVTNSGSRPVQIACTSGTASTGSTCSVDESVGIAFDIESAGLYLGCASFTHSTQSSAISDNQLFATFQIIETPNTSITITKEGNSRISSNHRNFPTTGDNISLGHPMRLCGLFDFTSAGQKTLRLMYEQSVNGTISSNILYGDRSTSNGQRDIHWEVYPLTQNFPAPLFTDLQNLVKSSSLKLKVETAEITQVAGTCAIGLEIGDWIQSISTFGAGFCDITVKSGVWATVNNVQCTVACVANKWPNFVHAGGNFRAGCLTDASTGANETRTIICAGDKP